MKPKIVCRKWSINFVFMHQSLKASPNKWIKLYSWKNSDLSLAKAKRQAVTKTLTKVKQNGKLTNIKIIINKTLQKISTNSIWLINEKKSSDWGTCWTKTSKYRFPGVEMQHPHFYYQLYHPHSLASCIAWNSALHVIQLYPMDSKLQHHQTTNLHLIDIEFHPKCKRIHIYKVT